MRHAAHVTGCQTNTQTPCLQVDRLALDEQVAGKARRVAEEKAKDRSAPSAVPHLTSTCTDAPFVLLLSQFQIDDLALAVAT